MNLKLIAMTILFLLSASAIAARVESEEARAPVLRRTRRAP